MDQVELEKLAEQIFKKTKGIPGIDLRLIQKCLSGIVSLNDPEIEAKLKLLAILL